MRVLLCHNYYQQPGGEDRVLDAEADLLRSHGHEVRLHTVHNRDVNGMGRARLALATVWHRRAYARVLDAVSAFRPAVVHFHNTFPLLSPAAYVAAHDGGAAVVQTLHNYRLACPNALFFRDGRVCEDCLRRAVPWPAVAHACYRGSRTASAATAVMLTVHRAAGTWDRAVDAYLTPTEFARRKLIEAGLPEAKVNVKPNFVHPDPGPGPGGGGYAAFVGRLSPEKGVGVLLDAWDRLSGTLPLKVVGDGPLAGEVRRACAARPDVEWLGARAPAEVYDVVGRAALLVVPSVWYETFGLVAVEALARGTPVVAPADGAVAEVVSGGGAGVLFRRGDGEDLARQVRRLASDPGRLARMRPAARAAFEARYTGGRNVELLTRAYRHAVDAFEASAVRHPPRDPPRNDAAQPHPPG